MFFKVLSLLLISLSFVLMEENGTREKPKEPKSLQRRYSEGTLASDYSQALDNMMKKNFVEWLLNRREKMIDNSIDPSKREAESITLSTRNQGTDAESLEGKDFIIWVVQMSSSQPFSCSFALPKDSDDWKAVLRQEFLT
ncbi:gastric inhibitory polypeptide [Elgaria multicarinata webbii]|uniref:gastric inhibitory polypeptide n=1 Tax=Elgaria multicarinata webbii TaxID=159646 RepID=UPI002FCD309F